MATSERKRRIRRDDEETDFGLYFDTLPLSRINGEINKMKKTEMIKLLEQNGLCSKGVKEVLNRRLKNFYKKLRWAQAENTDDKQYYRYFIVIDFEATCEKVNKPDYIHEIIEFPAILLDAESGKEIDYFHSYCRPTLNEKLSDFCTSLTGITQEDVDSAPEFLTVFKSFEKWMQDRDLLQRRCTAFVSDGPWDFSRFLNTQCCLSCIQYPKWARKWINLKKVYGNFYKINRPKIEEMLSNLGLKFDGRLHCGLDDARNLCKIISRMIEDGCILQVNERLSAGRLEPITEKERESLNRKAKMERVPENKTESEDFVKDGGSDKENTQQPNTGSDLKSVACHLDSLNNKLSDCKL